MRAIIQINRTRQLVKTLERIADALERAYPMPSAADLPQLDEKSLEKGSPDRERLKVLVREAMDRGVSPQDILDAWNPEEDVWDEPAPA